MSMGSCDAPAAAKNLDNAYYQIEESLAEPATTAVTVPLEKTASTDGTEIKIVYSPIV